MTITQSPRLSYTRRDVESYHDDVSRYLKVFIPRITETSEANAGRLYLTAFEALIDNANYSIDKAHNESLPTRALERKNVIAAAYLADYKPKNVSAATVDATVSMITGVAPPGGQAIPALTKFRTVSSPVVEFQNLSPAVIPEGEASAVVPLTEGGITTSYSLTVSASGEPHQAYTLPAPNTPDAHIEVRVNGTLWTRLVDNDLYLAGPQDENYYLTVDADNYVSVRFGDGVLGDDRTFGKVPPAGAVITVDFRQCQLGTGNVRVGAVTTVVGSLASTVRVTNLAGASGGADAESVSSIVRNLAGSHRSYKRAVTIADYESFSRSVPGVYDAYARASGGTSADIYLLPDGGGVASSALVAAVQTELEDRKLEGALVYVHPLSPASLLIRANIVLKNARIQKAAVKQKAKAAIEAALVYTEIKPGVGFKLSDIAAVIENIDGGQVVEYVDITVLTRVPSVKQSNPSAPAVVGRVQVFESAAYGSYLLQALASTLYIVSKDGIPQSTQGAVGVEFVSDAGDVRFTLGTASSTLTPGDTWTFKTSAYRDNVYLDPFEYQQLEKDSDLTLSVYAPNEYDFVTRT